MKNLEGPLRMRILLGDADEGIVRDCIGRRALPAQCLSDLDGTHGLLTLLRNAKKHIVSDRIGYYG